MPQRPEACNGIGISYRFLTRVTVGYRRLEKAGGHSEETLVTSPLLGYWDERDSARTYTGVLRADQKSLYASRLPTR